MTNREIVDFYRHYLEDQRHYSPHTVTAYLDDVGTLAAFLEHDVGGQRASAGGVVEREHGSPLVGRRMLLRPRVLQVRIGF